MKIDRIKDGIIKKFIKEMILPKRVRYGVRSLRDVEDFMIDNYP